MLLPETAAEAVGKYDAGQELAAALIMPGGPDVQTQFWRDVFEILRRFPMPEPKVLRPGKPELRDAQNRITQYAESAVVEPVNFTYSMMQFNAWCFQNGLAQPRQLARAAGKPVEYDPKDVPRADAVRATAFAILREGYRNVIERRAPHAIVRIAIKKQW